MDAGVAKKRRLRNHRALVVLIEKLGEHLGSPIDFSSVRNKKTLDGKFLRQQEIMVEWVKGLLPDELEPVVESGEEDEETKTDDETADDDTDDLGQDEDGDELSDEDKEAAENDGQDEEVTTPKRGRKKKE